MADANILKFVVEDDDGNRSVVPLQPGEITLGRFDDNTVALADRNISRHHAKVVLDAAGVGHAEDLASYNGVFVNGNRIDGQVSIRPGDVLRLGNVQLELRSNVVKAMSDEATQRQALGTGEETAPGVGAPSRPLPEELTHPDGEKTPLPDEATAPGASPPELTDPRFAAAAQLEAPFAKLLCLGSPRLGVAFELTRTETLFGRTGENHVALDHPSISRQHAIVRFDGQAWRVVDAGSANGTFVNGVAVQDAALHFGDLVELGHVRLRLVAPNEEPTLSDAEQAQALAEAQQPVPGNPRLTALSVVMGVVVVGLVAGAVYVRRPANRATVPPHGSADDAAAAGTPYAADLPLAAGGGTLAPSAGAAAGSEDEAQSLLAQANRQLEVRQYAKAGALANAVLAIDPKDPKGALKAAAQQLVEKAGVEERGELGLDAAKKAMAVRGWSDAFNALQNVPKDSSFYAEARGLLAQVRPALIEGRIAEAKESAEGHDWDEVELLVQEIAALGPDVREQAELAGLRQALAEARRGHPQKPAPAAPPKAAGKANGGKRNDRSEPGRTRASIGRPGQGSDDAKLLYAEGTRALAQNQLQRAIDAFNRCLVADKSHAMCYRALGIAYARSDSGAKAARFYRLYLKVDPGARDAAQVRELLRQYDSQPEPGEGKNER